MLKYIAVFVAMGLSTSIFAGDWQLKVGASALAPTSETMTPLGVVKANHELGFTPALEYFFTDSPLSTELLLAAPFHQQVLLDGAQVATLKHLPPTLTVKYHVKNSSRFTPYVGLGGTVLMAWDEQGVVKDVKETLGWAGQVGFQYQPADAKNWGVYVDVRYADLSPEVTLTEAAGNARFDLDIDPVVYTLGYSYKF